MRNTNRRKYGFRTWPKLGAAMAMVLFMAYASLGQTRPNIIIIMTDDMGYSDVGCYGSEIETPNLDGLAQNGVRFSQFYNTSRCCPTRAILMTGLYSHQAGLGGMMGDAGPDSPGYRGRLMERCVTIAEVLGPTGYLTIQTGK
jgi:arylsulfatase A-like enzyme